MKIHAIGNKNKLYITLVMSVTLCTVVTLLVSSYIYYRNYTNFALNQAFLSDLNSLNHTSNEVTTMKDSAQSLSFQIYRNSTIAKLLYYQVPNVYDETGGMTELFSYLDSMPYIESILAYNSSSETYYVASRSGQSGIFTVNELEDTDILDILQHFKDYKAFTPIPRVIKNNTNGGKGISAYSYLCFDAINKKQTINSAVVVNISAAWINKSIASNRDEFPGQTYIIDDKQRILSTNTLMSPNINPVETELIRSTVINQPSSYIIDTFHAEKSLISFTEKDSLGWQYVRVTPYHFVVDTTKAIQKTTLSISVIILLAGMIVAWFLSGILYRPIRRIIKNLNVLETEKRNNSLTIKQNALRGLLLGTRTLSNEMKLDHLKSIGIKFQFNHDYRVVLMKIDHFNEFKAKSGNDLPTYKYAIMNISSEIMSDSYEVETVDMDDDSLVMLLNSPVIESSSEEKTVDEPLRQIQNAIREFLSISVSIAYSPVTNEPAHIHPLYEQVKEAALHRMFYGHGCLIDSEEIVALKSKDYIYPMEKEKRLSDAFMVGKVEEAMELISEIIQETSQYPIHVMRLALSHLTMKINNLIYSIQKNGTLEFQGEFESYLPSADSVETMTELTSSFRTFLESVQSKLAAKRNVKQGDLSRNINELIEKHYADPNLSVNWISEQFNMSSLYVSRVYKQQTLNAILDVINDYRLEKAKELLEKSDHSIAQIAELTGYTSSSYFHRMFKKRIGVTPAEYRKAAADRQS